MVYTLQRIRDMDANEDTKGMIIKFMKENKIDPLMIFNIMLEPTRIQDETMTGPLFRDILLSKVLGGKFSVSDLIGIFRCMFYGTKSEGKLGITKMVNTGKTMVWKNARYETYDNLLQNRDDSSY